MSQTNPYILWIFGAVLTLCGGGFLLLFKWLMDISKELKTIEVELEKRVTYTWVEDSFFKNIETSLKSIKSDVKELKDALVGDIHNQGLISKVHLIEEKIGVK